MRSPGIDCRNARPSLQLRRIEDRLDAVAVDGVGPVALDGVGHQVRRELHHPRPRVRVPFLVEVHGEPVHRLQQRRQEQTDGPCTDDVNARRGGSMGIVPGHGRERIRARAVARLASWSPFTCGTRSTLPRSTRSSASPGAGWSWSTQHGGTHHGYFLPSEGASDIAYALFSFPSLAEYEIYRARFGVDPDFIEADRIRDESGCVKRFERTFLRPLFPDGRA